MLVGISVQDITPQMHVAMGGYGDRKSGAVGVLDPIHAKAIVLKDKNDVEIAIVSAELIGLGRKHIDHMKGVINSLTGIPAAHIVIATTHTHSGPLTHDYPTMGRASETYVNWLLEVIPGVVCQAQENLKECKVGWYQTMSSEVGNSRRNSEKRVEPYLTIMSFTDLKDNLLGALFNYNCHPTVLSYENLKISADYPGAAIALLERAYGKDVPFIFTNGACGDVSTRFTRRNQTYSEVLRLGNILSAEVIKGISKTVYKEDCTIDMKELNISLIPKELPEEEEANRRIEDAKNTLAKLKEQGASHGDIRIATTALQGALVEKMLREYSPYLEFDALVAAIRVGDGAIATVPSEMFSKLGNSIIESSPFSPTMVMGYANGSLGYMPDEASYYEGGYESLSCRFAPGEGERFSAMISSLLGELR